MIDADFERAFDGASTEQSRPELANEPIELRFARLQVAHYNLVLEYSSALRAPALELLQLKREPLQRELNRLELEASSVEHEIQQLDIQRDIMYEAANVDEAATNLRVAESRLQWLEIAHARRQEHAEKRKAHAALGIAGKGTRLVKP